MSWGEASHLESLLNSIDPAAPSGSMGILATTDSGFPSMAQPLLQGLRGYWSLLIEVPRAEFSSSSLPDSTRPSIYSFIYLPICI